MSSTIDQKRLFNKIKHDLEQWREIVIFINSLLKWDKQFYPAILIGSTTIFYLILWYLELSILTLFSLGVLSITVIDYVYPIISKILFKQENWSGLKENKFEEICQEICKIRMKLISYYNIMFSAKEQRSTTFVLSVTITLLILAWIGSVVDNLLLCYLTTLSILLYPGLQHHGYLITFKNKFGTIISSKLRQLKEKAIKTE